MPSSSTACPECGASAAGKFCSECGASLARTCPECGSSSPGAARYCQECGFALRDESQSAPAPTLGGLGVPWVLMGAAGIVLATLAIFLVASRGSTPAAAPRAPSREVTASSLDGLTVEQAAERLFNRVMMASETGDRTEAERFVGMALEAYAQLGELDADGHYHVGLLELVAGRLDRAQEHRDAIAETSPDHLLGILLEHAIESQAGDAEGERAAEERFLAVYASELERGRREYDEHRNGIESFRERAAR